jgi:hypothetical protein
MHLRRFVPFVRLWSPAIFLLAGAAWAQDGGSAIKDASDIVFNEGVELASKQEYAKAAERFRKAIALRDTLGARIELAKCYEQLGKVASALEQWRHVQTEAAKEPDNPKAQRRRKLASDAIPALEPRLSAIVLEVPESLGKMTGFLIKLDKEPVAAVHWGQTIPADVGDHALEVTALDQVPWRKSLQVNAEKETIRIRIDPPWTTGTESNGTVSRDHTGSASGLRIVGGIGMGLGAVGLGVGGVFGGLAIARNNASNDGHCDAQDRCNRTGYDLRKEALSFATISTAAAIAGGVALTAGIVIFAIAPTKKPHDHAVNAQLQLGLSGLNVLGTF